MGISIAIKKYFILQDDQTKEAETIKDDKPMVVEVVLKVLGILTVMCAYWTLLMCCGNRQQVMMQLLFFFVSMFFAGEYGLPSAFFLELLHRRNPQDLKFLERNPLYKKTWSHNVVFQTGMYFLFLLIILVEKAQNVPTESIKREETDQTTSSQSYQYFERLFLAINQSDLSWVNQLLIKWVWPPVLAVVLLYYTHTMDIHIFTTGFYTLILCLMIYIRYKRRSNGTWSLFYSQYYPDDDEEEERRAESAPLITLGLFSKLSVYGLAALFAFTIWNEINITAHQNLLASSIPMATILPATSLFHMNNWP